MMYLHAALAIHEAGGTISEETIKKVVTDAGATPDDGKVRALIAALKDVNIEQVIKEAATMPAAPAAPTGGAKPAEKKEASKEDTKKAEEAAAAGLGALFG